MLVAKSLKNKNIAEYLLYMWQVEDLMRAERFEIENIYSKVIDRYDQPENVKQEIKVWYENLIDMMRIEGIMEKGHLAINNNVILGLTDLHNRLLKSPKEAEYTATYYKTLPFIVELRSKNKVKETAELETCFSALYGMLLMRLQGRDISGETQAAISQISNLLRMLAAKYNDDQAGVLDIED